MTAPVPRIRWEANEDGRASTAAFRGYAGTSDAVNFAIYAPYGRDRGWVLRSDLPGQDQYRTSGDRLDDLKRHAERWLEEFVSSLGASFPDDSATTLGRLHAVVKALPVGAEFEALYEPGRRVRFTSPDHGWPGQGAAAAEHLTLGEVYTIAWSDVGFSKTRLGLEGITADHGQGFNSVLFEVVADEGGDQP